MSSEKKAAILSRHFWPLPHTVPSVAAGRIYNMSTGPRDATRYIPINHGSQATVSYRLIYMTETLWYIWGILYIEARI